MALTAAPMLGTGKNAITLIQIWLRSSRRWNGIVDTGATEASHQVSWTRIRASLA